MRIADDLAVAPSLDGIQPEMAAVFPIIDGTYEKIGYEAILTSGTEGVHGPNSLHPKGLATDWRTRHMREDLRLTLVTRLQKNLGKEFQVILETKPPHIHIEFDRKER